MTYYSIKNTLLALVLCLAQSFPCQAQPAAIASAHPLATYAGFEILDQGGNAFDAAIAVAAALAVVEPASSGLGGGGFWLLHRASDDFQTMLDSREKAPLAAKPTLYLDANGQVNAALSKHGGLAAAIPGLPAALVHLAEHYGQLPLSQSLKPAIRYATQCFVPGERHRKLLAFALTPLKNNPEAARIFLEQQQLPAPDKPLCQPELAKTLQSLADDGKDGFYDGEIATKLVQAVNANGGIWTRQDLENYQVIERQPLTGSYRGIRITTAAPPSAGGVALLQSLNMLSVYPLPTLNRIQQTHLITEALRRSFRDRVLLGDPDFVGAPLAMLLNPDYAAGLRRSIRLDKALPSAWLSDGDEEKIDGQNTSHLSIIDPAGNRVAATLSINFPFGAGFVAEGTGIVLNDEMDDFANQVGEANGYGLVGAAADRIESGKRMLSSMTPTFLEDENRIAVLGTPGGSRIPSMLLLAVLDFAQGHPASSWVAVPRFHHQYLPDVLSYEPGAFSEDELSRLSALGHQPKAVGYRYGDMQAVEFNKQSRQFSAASDPRGEGLGLVR